MVTPAGQGQRSGDGQRAEGEARIVRSGDAPPMPPEAAFERPADDELELLWYVPASPSREEAETVALKQVTLVFSGVGSTRTMSAHCSPAQRQTGGAIVSFSATRDGSRRERAHLEVGDGAALAAPVLELERDVLADLEAEVGHVGS